MQQANIRDGAGTLFKVLQTSRKSQTAIMTLAPGESSGPKGNEHPKSEQTLLVLEGEILADIGSKKRTLRKGDIVIVPPGVEHRFVNHGGSPAITFNVYAPPAYDADEED
jgi:mannose-6-phosphate isomerase-like protein (cupin superfamily)